MILEVSSYQTFKEQNNSNESQLQIKYFQGTGKKENTQLIWQSQHNTDTRKTQEKTTKEHT